ncbi:type II and III secretion system protein, partial [Treponema socranskii]
ETSGKGYFISRGARGQNGRSTEDFGITVKDGLYSLSLKKALSGTVFDALFKKAGKEYALLNKTAVALENLYYTDKDFDTLLHLILEQ